MAKFPEPPATLTIPPETTSLRAGTLLWRVCFAGGTHPVQWNTFRHFGPNAARFDHHDLPAQVQAKGILYAASGSRGAQTCLAEVFQATRVVDRTARNPWLVAFKLQKDLSLLDVMGNWPTRAGASMAMNSGPRPRARRWSHAIHAAYATVDGLLYGSSMNANQPALALYERSQRGFPAAPTFHRALADPTMGSRLGAAARVLGYGLV